MRCTIYIFRKLLHQKEVLYAKINSRGDFVQNNATRGCVCNFSPSPSSPRASASSSPNRRILTAENRNQLSDDGSGLQPRSRSPRHGMARRGQRSAQVTLPLPVRRAPKGCRRLAQQASAFSSSCSSSHAGV
jgi:hypothetical protein